jgi:hypothetical protein
MSDGIFCEKCLRETPYVLPGVKLMSCHHIEPVLRIRDILVIDLQDAKKKFFASYLLVHYHQFSKIKSNKELT